MEQLLKEINEKSKEAFPNCPTRRSAFKKGAYAFSKFEMSILAHVDFSKRTFPESTKESGLIHLKEEIKEVEQDFSAEEYADCLMCLFNSIALAGYSISDITEALQKKIAVNAQRKWIKNPDNTYSHLKEEKIILTKLLK